MATYEEVATLASVLNEQLKGSFDADSLVYLIETFIEDNKGPYTKVPISEITERVHDQILCAEAFVAAEAGDSIEEIDRALDTAAELLGLDWVYP